MLACGVPQFQHQLQGHPAGARQASGGRRGAAQRRAGRARGPLWRGPSLGAPGFSHRATIRKARIGVLCEIALVHNSLWKTSLRRCLAPPCVQSPAAAGRWKGHPVARAAVRPAALSPPRSRERAARSDQPLRRLPPTRVRQAPAPGSMHDPYGDSNDISGARDDAPMETKSTTGPRDKAHHMQAARPGAGWQRGCTAYWTAPPSSKPP